MQEARCQQYYTNKYFEQKKKINKNSLEDFPRNIPSLDRRKSPLLVFVFHIYLLSPMFSFLTLFFISIFGHTKSVNEYSILS
jgi:hypothetical protein